MTYRNFAMSSGSREMLGDNPGDQYRFSGMPRNPWEGQTSSAQSLASNVPIPASKPDGPASIWKMHTGNPHFRVSIAAMMPGVGVFLVTTGRRCATNDL